MSLCVCVCERERVYIGLFMRREQELEEVQLVPCASCHGLVSSFPWVFLLSLFYFISISKPYVFPASVI